MPSKKKKAAKKKSKAEDQSLAPAAKKSKAAPKTAAPAKKPKAPKRKAEAEAAQAPSAKKPKAAATKDWKVPDKSRWRTARGGKAFKEIEPLVVEAKQALEGRGKEKTSPEIAKEVNRILITRQKTPYKLAELRLRIPGEL